LGITAEDIGEVNAQMQSDYDREYKVFKNAYNTDECYLCGKSFATITKENPCLHWLLRRCKFKKKNFIKLYKKYDYHQVAAFLRWVANEEVYLKNINDMESEKTEGKIIQYTVRWKNIEWSFESSKNDFSGHANTRQDYPHYHFQMRIDGKQFINYSDFHAPLSASDIQKINFVKDEGMPFVHSFGPAGIGMQEIMNIDVEALYGSLDFSGDEFNGILHGQTIISSNNEEGISCELIDDVYDESRKTGVAVSKILRGKLANTEASVITILSPVEGIPEIAKRTGHKRR